MELTPLMVGGGRLRGGQAARVLHGNGHGAGEQVAGAQGIGSGHGWSRCPSSCSKVPSSVTWAVWPTAEIGGIGSGEFQRQQSFWSCRG